ncbi:glycosyltransferase family 9 protein [Nakamurella sp. GG22]
MTVGSGQDERAGVAPAAGQAVGSGTAAGGMMAAALAPAPCTDSADAVLVLRALGLGDALTGIPALRGIRRAWPGRRLVLAASAPIGGWLRGLGVVDEVLVTDGLAPLNWPPKGWIGAGGHLAVNLHGSGPRSHRVLEMTAPAELVAYRCPLATHLSGPEWRHDEHEVDRWSRLIVAAGGRCDATDLWLPNRVERGEDVVLHPGAASGSRRWPAERWSMVAAELARQGHQVVISGGAVEIALCQDIAERAVQDAGARHAAVRVDAGRDLFGLTELVAGAQLLICGDTGVAHLATALRTPSVLLFGPTPPRWWGPRIDLDRHRVLWKGDRGYLGDPHDESIDPVLEAISVDEVIDAATRKLPALVPADAEPAASAFQPAQRAS